MKLKNLKCLPIVLITGLLFSCASAVQLEKTEKKYSSNAFSSESQIAFIGFKADNTLLARTDYGSWKNFANLDPVRQLGSELQGNNIADDQSHAYFGLYSLQEIKEFKTDKRYITFVEVSNHSITYSDKKPGNMVGLTLGSIAVGAGSGLAFYYPKTAIPLVLGGSAVSLLSCIGKGKCTLHAVGEYNIYLYDRENQRIVTRVTADVDQTDVVPGNWAVTDDAGREKVLNYYGRVIANEILKKYDDIQAWVTNNY